MKKYKRTKPNFSPFDPNDFISYGLNQFIIKCSDQCYETAKKEIIETFNIQSWMINNDNPHCESYVFSRYGKLKWMTNIRCENYFYFKTGVLLNDKHRFNASGYKTLIPNHIKWLWTGFMDGQIKK